MNTNEIYQSISSRNDGDLYIGVVGPVRCGKSTFIAKFLKELVLPNIANENDKNRTIDEMPQSANGTVVMTTQPKFFPATACKVNLCENVKANVRIVDCVGYMVDGAEGGEGENLAERLVKTPWSEAEIPFSRAAEIGTEKVIKDHSNLGIVLTSDGSISSIARPNYVEAEEKCVAKLKALKKPFVIVLNSAKPQSEEAKKLTDSLKQKYEVPVICLDATKLDEKQIANIFANMLSEFPFEKIEFKIPSWLRVLPIENEIIEDIVGQAQFAGANIKKIGDSEAVVLFENSNYFEQTQKGEVDLDRGTIVFQVKPKDGLFYKVLSQQAELEIKDEFDLVKIIKQLSSAKQSYDKIREAMESLEANGYGVVNPTPEQMTLSEPEIIKQGNCYGVKLKASAPSLHIMKVDIETEVNPILGTEAQSQELVKNMMMQFESNPQALWETNIFGKSLFELVNDGLKSKLSTMPISAQQKMRKTLGRIVNEGKGGVICILL